MIANSRIQELIRENKPEYVAEAIAEGAFFQMQTLTKALIELVLAGEVDEEVAAGAAPNRHDFTIALAFAQKEDAVRRQREAEAAQAVAEAAAAGAIAEQEQIGLKLVDGLRVV